MHVFVNIFGPYCQIFNAFNVRLWIRPVFTPGLLSQLRYHPAILIYSDIAEIMIVAEVMIIAEIMIIADIMIVAEIMITIRSASHAAASMCQHFDD